MKTRFLIAPALALLVSFGMSEAGEISPAQHHQTPEASEHQIPCPSTIETFMMSAAEELVKRDNFIFSDFEVKGTVGTICAMRENMTDVAILVDLGSGKYRYGVFHLHFSSEGKLIPTEGSAATLWRETGDRLWWREEWCHHLKTSMQSYASKLGRYGCQP